MIRALRDLDDYKVAEIDRKKTEACVTAISYYAARISEYFFFSRPSQGA